MAISRLQFHLQGGAHAVQHATRHPLAETLLQRRHRRQFAVFLEEGVLDFAEEFLGQIQRLLRLT